MKLSEKIEGYADMSAEEKLKALEELDIEEPKDNSSELLKLKEALNKASSETASYKKQLKEKLTEQEKIEAERKEKEAEREELLNKLLKEKSVAEFKANFLERGYNEELANTSAMALADGDFKTVFDNLGTFISDRDKKAQVKALDSTPRPNAGGVAPEVTKEQFEKMSFKERNELFEKNKELYDKLKGE